MAPQIAPAHLFVEDPERGLFAQPIHASVVALEDAGGRLAVRSDGASASPPAGYLARAYIDSDDATFVLVAGSNARFRVNGLPVVAGIAFLHDRDEICLNGVGRCFLSTERSAQLVPFPEGLGPVPCARCASPIEAGSPAVQCPRCGVWYHQAEDLPCWTYAPGCAECTCPTDLGSEFRWVPEGF